AVLFALYGTAIYFDGQILSPSLILFLETLLVFLVLRACDAPTVRRWIAAGVVLGLAILARPEIAILGVGVVVWVSLARRPAWPAAVRARALGAFAAAAIAV